MKEKDHTLAILGISLLLFAVVILGRDLSIVFGLTGLGFVGYSTWKNLKK